VLGTWGDAALAVLQSSEARQTGGGTVAPPPPVAAADATEEEQTAAVRMGALQTLVALASLVTKRGGPPESAGGHGKRSAAATALDALRAPLAHAAKTYFDLAAGAGSCVSRFFFFFFFFSAEVRGVFSPFPRAFCEHQTRFQKGQSLSRL
jgi:hypothetical protein